jgi:hypothetical protein
MFRADDSLRSFLVVNTIVPDPHNDVPFNPSLFTNESLVDKFKASVRPDYFVILGPPWMSDALCRLKSSLAPDAPWVTIHELHGTVLTHDLMHLGPGPRSPPSHNNMVDRFINHLYLDHSALNEESLRDVPLTVIYRLYPGETPTSERWKCCVLGKRLRGHIPRFEVEPFMGKNLKKAKPKDEPLPIPGARDQQTFDFTCIKEFEFYPPADPSRLDVLNMDFAMIVVSIP